MPEIPDSFFEQDAEVTVGNETDSSDYTSDPRTNPDNWDSDSGDSEDVTGGGTVDYDTGGSGWGSDDDGGDDGGSEYSLDSDPRQNPDNWQSDSGDASDVTGGGRVDPEDDEWAQEQQADANEGTDIEGALAEQRAAYEEQIASLMGNLPVPDQLGGSDSGGGLSPALGAVALLALGGGALYVQGGS